MSARILVVDDEPAIVHALKTLLSREGFEVDSSNDGEDALTKLEQQQFNLLISDIHMDPIDGLELLRVALKQHPRMAVVMITAYGSVDSALQAMKLGAFDYVTKPFRFDELIKTVNHALEYERRLNANGHTDDDAIQLRYFYRLLVGDSSPMRRVYQLVDSIAESTQPVLTIGEKGTGKTLVSWIIHCKSGRYRKPYGQVSCSWANDKIKKQVIQADILQQSQGGSLLLEDLDQLDLGMQKVLLRYFQARQQVVVNGQRVPRNTRLLLTAERDIQKMVQRGEFIEELYYELAAVPMDLPPLRGRLQDLPLLVQHFLNQFEEKEGIQVTVSTPVMKAMENYDWPGNLRELRDMLYVAARASKTGTIVAEDLPTALRQLVQDESEILNEMEKHRWHSLRTFLKRKESDFVKHILQVTGGDLSVAAEVIGMDLEEFKKKYGK